MPVHRFSHQSLRKFIAEIFVAASCERHEASVVADHLIQANLTGHDSHGVIRTPIYVRWLGEGKVRANQRLAVIFENVAVVDVQMGLGQTIAEQAMTLSIQKTRKAVSPSSRSEIAGTSVASVIGRRCRLGYFVNTSGLGLLVAPVGGINRPLSDVWLSIFRQP